MNFCPNEVWSYSISMFGYLCVCVCGGGGGGGGGGMQKVIYTQYDMAAQNFVIRNFCAYGVQ